MKLVVVSSNPLFAEVLNDALEGHENYEVFVAAPGEFSQVLAEIEPDVIIVDEDLGQAVSEPILTAAREKTSSRIILLNPKDNRVCVLDSRRTIIQEVGDLCQAIGRQTPNVSSTPLPLVDCDKPGTVASVGATKEVEQQPNQS